MICGGWYNPGGESKLMAPVVRISHDGGHTWEDRGFAIDGVPGVFEDKEFIACDRTGSLFDGRLYMAWTRFYDTDIYCVWSADDGATWTLLTGSGSVTESLETAQFYSLAMHPTDPSILLVGGQDVGTLRRDGSSFFSIVHAGSASHDRKSDTFICLLEALRLWSRRERDVADTGRAAVRALEDQRLLAQVASRSGDRGVRNEAFSRLTAYLMHDLKKTMAHESTSLNRATLLQSSAPLFKCTWAKPPLFLSG